MIELQCYILLLYRFTLNLIYVLILASLRYSFAIDFHQISFDIIALEPGEMGSRGPPAPPVAHGIHRTQRRGACDILRPWVMELQRWANATRRPMACALDVGSAPITSKGWELKRCKKPGRLDKVICHSSSA